MLLSVRRQFYIDVAYFEIESWKVSCGVGETSNNFLLNFTSLWMILWELFSYSNSISTHRYTLSHTFIRINCAKGSFFVKMQYFSNRLIGHLGVIYGIFQWIDHNKWWLETTCSCSRFRFLSLSAFLLRYFLIYIYLRQIISKISWGEITTRKNHPNFGFFYVTNLHKKIDQQEKKRKNRTRPKPAFNSFDG